MICFSYQKVFHESFNTIFYSSLHLSLNGFIVAVKYPLCFFLQSNTCKIHAKKSISLFQTGGGWKLKYSLWIPMNIGKDKSAAGRNFRFLPGQHNLSAGWAGCRKQNLLHGYPVRNWLLFFFKYIFTTYQIDPFSKDPIFFFIEYIHIGNTKQIQT